MTIELDRNPFELRLLGVIEAKLGDHFLPLGPRQSRLVLAVLAWEVNRLVPVARLVDLVWPESPPRSAAHSVRVCVSNLRILLKKAGAELSLHTRGSGYLLQADPAQIDVHRFRALAARARETSDIGKKVALLDEALRLWRGPALADTASDRTRERLCAGLEEARLVALEDRYDAMLRMGHHRGVTDELIVLAENHPTRERLIGQLMLALYRGGQAGQALEVFRRTRAHLADELGIDPGNELRQLELSILRNDGGPAPAPPEPGATRRDLPVDIGDFTGRQAELRQLLTALGTDDRRPATIVAIDGMAGVGKTALAVHVAHRLAPRYPGGQLFVDLRGHTPGRQPLTAPEALGKLLRAAGVHDGDIPESEDERATLWRTTLADRRVLIVLDNAADTTQAARLLPGASGCLVLLTSRRRLTDVDGALLLSLDVLSDAEAAELFGRVVGDTRPAAHPEAVAAVVSLCGNLPLAVRIAAARLRHRPSWSVPYLAGRLHDHQRRLAELRGEGRSVSAGFTLSYQYLTADQQRTFRLLGLHPAPDLDAPTVAALIERPLRRTEDLLEDLVDAHLLQQPIAGRYRFQALLRIYAAQLARSAETDASRTTALMSLCAHYLGDGHRATGLSGGYEVTTSTVVTSGRPLERPPRGSEAPRTATPGVVDQAVRSHFDSWHTGRLSSGVPQRHS